MRTVFGSASQKLVMVYGVYSIRGCVQLRWLGGIVGIPAFLGHDRGLVGGGDRVSVCTRMYENRLTLVDRRSGLGENGARTPLLIGGSNAEEG